jgi:hypothetical protein
VSRSFTYNPDYERRDFLLGIDGDWDEKNALGGIKSFGLIELDILEILFRERFIDPSDRQNESPTMQEFLGFMRKHPAAVAHGYAVSPNRDDYRVTIEGLRVPAKDVTWELEEAFAEFCGNADELVTNGELYSWWD